jgi:hypothetical protein
MRVAGERLGSAMAWEHVVILVWLTVGFVQASRQIACKYSTGLATFGILLAIAEVVGVALVLSSGGFW